MREQAGPNLPMHSDKDHACKDFSDEVLGKQEGALSYQILEITREPVSQELNAKLFA